MAYLVDTCVLSEITRVRPHAQVVAWFGQRDAAELFTAQACVAELRRGIEKVLAMGPQQVLRGQAWMASTQRLQAEFAGRVLESNEAIWGTWARWMGQGDATGRVRKPIDTLIAATAFHHNHTIVTRNLRDFDDLVPCVNPWG
jgi:toxin FitB